MGLKEKSKTAAKSSRWVRIAFLIILGLSTIMLVFLGTLKTEFIVDEQWTYGLSNSYEKTFFFNWYPGIDVEYQPQVQSIDEYYSSWHSSEEFKNYITVQPNERFTYDNVYSNQENDVHPPLYYFIIHTICSFFPDTFSKWFALVPNIIFFVLSLFFLFRISQVLFRSDIKALITIAFYGFSRAAIIDVMFLRMYMLMTLLALISFYLHQKIIDREKFSYKFIVGAVIVNILGFLTQYYFYVLGFFLAAVTCIIFLKRKQIRNMIIYACSILFSVVVSVAIFPETLNNLTGGVYGQATASNFKNVFSGFGFLRNFKYYVLWDFTALNINIERIYITFFLRYLFSLLLIILCILVIFKVLKLKNKCEDADEIIKQKLLQIVLFIKKIICSIKRKINLQWLFLFMTIFLTGALISLVCPNMPGYQDRYLFFIFPFCAIFIVYLVFWLVNIVVKLVKRIPVMNNYNIRIFPIVIIILAFFDVNSNLAFENSYLSLHKGDIYINDVVEDSICFFVPLKNRGFVVHQWSNTFMNSDSVYASNALNENLAREIDGLKTDKKVYVIIEGYGIKKEKIDDYFQDSVSKKVTFVDEIYHGKDSLDDMYYLYEIY